MFTASKGKSTSFWLEKRTVSTRRTPWNKRTFLLEPRGIWWIDTGKLSNHRSSRNGTVSSDYRCRWRTPNNPYHVCCYSTSSNSLIGLDSSNTSTWPCVGLDWWWRERVVEWVRNDSVRRCKHVEAHHSCLRILTSDPIRTRAGSSLRDMRLDHCPCSCASPARLATAY